ncbi:MAG: hypothetical protein ACREBG_02555 [Pyrinomonadaceae bacterium]
MKAKSLFWLRLVSALALVVCLGCVAFAQSTAYPQTQESKTPDKNASNVPEAEAKAANAITTEPDAAAKLVAAEKFLKKYPKSTVRLGLAGYIAGQIAAVPDVTQRLALTETFQNVFTADKEREAIQPIVFDSLLEAKRIDDAFSFAAVTLVKQPDSVGILTQMAIAGTEEAKRQNGKYVAVSLQYGLKSIEMIEANKKPANLDDASWANQQALLPRLYQSVGLLSMISGNPAEAKTRIDKAVALNPGDPTSYVLLGSIVDDEYQQVAQAYRTMPEGKAKEETLKKGTELMDKVIDLYAHALGASQGKPEFKPLYDQILQAVTTYYKYRHNQSTEGLQQLIDKYKVPAKP